jgi:hypothetical protein
MCPSARTHRAPEPKIPGGNDVLHLELQLVLQLLHRLLQLLLHLELLVLSPSHISGAPARIPQRPGLRRVCRPRGARTGRGARDDRQRRKLDLKLERRRGSSRTSTGNSGRSVVPTASRRGGLPDVRAASNRRGLREHVRGATGTDPGQDRPPDPRWCRDARSCILGRWAAHVGRRDRVDLARSRRVDSAPLPAGCHTPRLRCSV